MTEPLLGHLLLAGVALQRAAELVVATRNLRRLVARGARVVEHDVTGAMVVLHVLWFAGILAERLWLGARMPPPLVVPLLVALALVEGLRAWTLATLGRRWTIRVVVVPGEVPVSAGPYRLLKHPNYVVVLLEVLLIPAWLGAWRTAAALALPHLATLLARIRREERAWREVASRPLGAP